MTQITHEPVYELALVVNRDDQIMSVSSNWDERAQNQGGGAQLFAQALIGQALSRFIRSDNTRMYIEACLKVCRLKQQVLFRPYRCDSPTHKRFMEMQLSPLAEGAVEMKHFLLKEEAFEQPLRLETVASAEPGSGYAYVRCSMCNRLKPRGQSQWLEPQRCVHQPQPLRVIYSVCPACLAQIWQTRPRPR